MLLVSGPNLNLLGTREPELYGKETLDELVERAEKRSSMYGMVVDHVQSNHEGVLVDAIQEAIDNSDGIIINAGAFTHYSWAIHDALRMFEGPIIELHITDPTSREEFRHVSVVTPVAAEIIQGQGPAGYEMAVDKMAELLGVKPNA